MLLKCLLFYSFEAGFADDGKIYIFKEMNTN